jgi:hypothetical protein
VAAKVAEYFPPLQPVYSEEDAEEEQYLGEQLMQLIAPSKE